MRSAAKAGRGGLRGAWLAAALSLAVLAAGCGKHGGDGRADAASDGAREDKPAAAMVRAPADGDAAADGNATADGNRPANGHAPADGNAVDPALNWGGTTPHDTPPLPHDPAAPADKPRAD